MEQADDHGFSVSRSVSSVDGKDAKSSKTDVEEQMGDGDALLRGFSPLLNSMRVFGLYFTHASRRIHDVSSMTPDSAVPKKWNRGRIYAVIILVILWLNATRMLSAFKKADKFGYILLLKMAAVSAGLFSAVLQTACFVACQTGNLDRVFLDARLPKSDHIRYRRLAVIHAIVMWVLLAGDMLIFLLPTFAMEQDLNASLTPFGVHVFVSDKLLLLVQLMAALAFLLSVGAWFFSHSVNYAIFTKVLQCSGMW